jgi:UDP-N-acetylmuramoylalanine--D-glutamate ligase
MASTALVYGLAITGEATARALRRRGWWVIAADDHVTPSARAVANELDVEIVTAPDPTAIARLVAGVDLVSPSPGVPEDHPVIAAASAAGVPVRSEIELAYCWEQERDGGPRPLLAITGTDGKTTTTLLATAMVEASGKRAVAAGNTDVPLVSALELDADVFVVECTSFRLAWTEQFRPDAGTWLNLAPDHLDWHLSLASYETAKARIWMEQRLDDVAVGFSCDPVVMRHLAAAPGRRVTFAATGADYHTADGALHGPGGELADLSSLSRSLPHDVTNSLAAAATVLETGVASRDGVASALANFTGPRHRIELVASAGGVDWYDDSKATTPHAASTAVRGFRSVVLLAGGRNKGLDLTPLAQVSDHLRAVVAIGDAAPDVIAAFTGTVPVEEAGSMADAVDAAMRLARRGDAVLLSPACASFDWYSSYGERGDDFARLVREALGTDA